MTGDGPFWNRKSRERGVFWFLVLLFCFKKKKIIKSESFKKKPKTPTRDGCRELRRATPVANPSEDPENRAGVG